MVDEEFTQNWEEKLLALEGKYFSINDILNVNENMEWGKILINNLDEFYSKLSKLGFSLTAEEQKVLEVIHTEILDIAGENQANKILHLSRIRKSSLRCYIFENSTLENSILSSIRFLQVLVDPEFNAIQILDIEDTYEPKTDPSKRLKKGSLAPIHILVPKLIEFADTYLSQNPQPQQREKL